MAGVHLFYTIYFCVNLIISNVTRLTRREALPHMRHQDEGEPLEKVSHLYLLLLSAMACEH